MTRSVLSAKMRAFATVTVAVSVVVVAACTSAGGFTPAQIEAALADSSYGYTADNPIRVGGGGRRGVYNERRFLESLRGPQGQAVRFQRRGSCCSTGRPPTSILDIYEITYDGLSAPVRIYVDMYRSHKVRAPNGFTRVLE